MIAGYHGALSRRFLSLLGTIQSGEFSHSAQTQVIGITTRLPRVLYRAAGINHGFLDINGAFTTVDFPAQSSTSFSA